MKGQVLLLVMSDVKWGGFITFTVHLYWALEQQGWKPVIARLSTRPSQVQYAFSQGLYFRRLTAATALSLAKQNRVLITCLNWKQHGEEAKPLMAAGAGLVLHDPTEYHPELLAEAKAGGVRTISIRSTNVKNLAAKGIDSRFIQHPYLRAAEPLGREKTKHAITLSRIDWDKHTDEIVAANHLLPVGRQIEIYGQVNRMYEHHKLVSQDPEWRRFYRGGFSNAPRAAVELAASAKYVVDMSAIKADGGGTQYTFLEAWEAGAALVVSKKWITGNDDVLCDWQNCIVVDGPVQLASQLHDEPPTKVIEMGRGMLDHHAPEVVIPQYEAQLNWGEHG